MKDSKIKDTAKILSKGPTRQRHQIAAGKKEQATNLRTYKTGCKPN